LAPPFFQTRLSAVTELTDLILRDKLRFLLKEVSDLERLVGRLKGNHTQGHRMVGPHDRRRERSATMAIELAS